jgi:nitrogen fixation protein FixH
MIAARKPFTLRGSHVLAALLLFFGAVIAVNVGFIVMAVGSFPGEDVRRSYLQGLNYNETLAERRAQGALGWQAQAALTPEGHEAVLRITLTDRDGAPVTAEHVTGELRWPTDSRRDRAVSFRSEGGGVYAARFGDLQPGRWRLRAQAAGIGQAGLDFEADLTWPTAR